MESSPAIISIEERSQLSEEEYLVLSKNIGEIKHNDHILLLSLLDKLKESDNKELISVCCTRLATSMDRSRIPYFEKAHFWKSAAVKAEEANLDSWSLYRQAGAMYGRDLDHHQSAVLYRKAAKLAIKEIKCKENIQNLFIDCRTQFELSGHTDKASQIFIDESDYKLKSYPLFQKVPLFMYKYLATYGESPWRVVFWSFLLILVCAIIYSFSGIYSSVTEDVTYSFATSVYYSIVTFTTLGYGDYSPASSLTKTVSSIQALSGLLLTSLFLVTVVRKYSR